MSRRAASATKIDRVVIAAGDIKAAVRVLAHDLYVQEVMNKRADPRLVWVATVLAVAVFVVYVAHI